ncbi:MAG: T9SS type A sorting domain-containing protein [Bacteroidales bacterium]|nr:T9SS type A sorting domain-containing protein [Bacteroidales bacterium]
MKKLMSIGFTIALLGIALSTFAQGYHVRIGTIGNSITHGVVLSDPATQAFPALLNNLLKDVYGDTCIVTNYGLTSTTMLKNGDIPYWECQQFRDYLSNVPEICFIMLGTNDTKPQNWDVHGDEYIGDYLSMIDTIKQRNPSTVFLLAYPPPAFYTQWGIRDSVIINGVIPAIDSVLKIVDAELIDFYHPLLDSGHLFNDGIHPFEQGNVVMADMLLERFIETDLIHKADTGNTFITQFETSLSPLRLGDSAVLSWTSINADSLLLDGIKVDQEGSLTIAPEESTTYKMIAYGQKGNDTLSLVQEIYVPELAKLTLNPYKVTRYAGDTVFFQTYYWDQLNRKITDTHYTVSWEITRGSGTTFNPSDTSIFFIVESMDADTSTLQASYEDIIGTAEIITRKTDAVTGLSQEALFKVFPNPADQVLQIQFLAPASKLEVELFDIHGKLVMKNSLTNVLSHQEVSLDVDNILRGTYLLKVSIGENFFVEKLSIR